MTNKEKYRKYCETESSISVFCKDWWLDCVCGAGNWDVCLVEKGGQIAASMPYVSRKRKGFLLISQPLLTQTLGIHFNHPLGQKYYKKLSFEKEMINEIVRQLPKFDRFSGSFHFETTNLLPFIWDGFTVSVNYTYVISNVDIDSVEKQFDTDIRRRIRNVEECGISVYEDDDVEIFYELNKQTFLRQGLEVPYDYKFICSLHSTCIENKACKMFFAQDKDGKVIAANFLVFDCNSVFYLMGGIDQEKKSSGAMDAIQLESIRFALESNRSYDFEGSMIESIEKYFRSFGAIQKPYFSISKTNSKLLKVKELFTELFKR